MSSNFSQRNHTKIKFKINIEGFKEQLCGQAEQVSTIVTMVYCLFILVYFQLKIEDSVFQWQNFEILFMEAYESLSKDIYDLILINSAIFERIRYRHSAIALFENGAMESYFFIIIIN